MTPNEYLKIKKATDQVFDEALQDPELAQALAYQIERSRKLNIPLEILMVQLLEDRKRREVNETN